MLTVVSKCMTSITTELVVVYRGFVKEEYLVIILGYFFLFVHKPYVVGTQQ